MRNNLSSINFSIIIPTYKRPKLLKNNINNLLKMYSGYFDKNNEIIVVDNNSMDDTESMVKDFMRKHRFIKYFKEENESVNDPDLPHIEYSQGI